jgi:CheY-like chemotaxis protein
MRKLKCVLLVDDDAATNFLNKKIIESSGLIDEVHVAESGVRALEFLSAAGEEHATFNCKPDMILLDINMPAMDGWEFMDNYRNLHLPKGEIVIVMLTTSLNPDDEIKAHEIRGITAFKNKPLTKNLLREIVVQYF